MPLCFTPFKSFVQLEILRKNMFYYHHYMKKLFYLASLAAAAIAVSSCQKEVVDNTTPVEGKMVEMGKHEELLALGGYYKKLVDMQNSK